MHFLILSLIFVFSGCASVQMPEYISRVDHPYERKYYAGFEKVTSIFMYVLKKQGWTVSSESDPAIYERDDRYDNNGYRNLLIMTEVKKQFLHLTNVHLNIFIHSIGNTCDVEVRYEAQAGLVKQFTSGHNDKIVQGILDATEEEING